jgi:nicotinate-nucleotide pyrophosphorylase (carboxylating)
LTVLPQGTAELIELALREDIGDGDHSALSTIPANARGAARLLVKSDGVLAGVELAQEIVKRFDPELHMRVFLEDGARIKVGDVAFTLMGPARSILTIERLVLNFMQRMSGVATMTDRYVQAVADTGCKVLDTRKTTPGMRAVEKWAVRIGGGHNHRHGLFDMIMIKDNHTDLCGGISQAIASAHAYLHSTGRSLPIEVETRNMKEVEQVLVTGGVQRIMLDNFTPEQLKVAVDRIAGRFETEASGGITLATIRSYALTGVDMISVGALTHSVTSLDLSLKAL